MNRTVLLISAALTAFLLVILGVLITLFTQNSTATNTPPTPTMMVPAPAATPITPMQTPQVAISPVDAGTLALAQVPGATLQGTPELVNFEGNVAYEVILDRGTLYIDANRGEVLYNSTTTAPPPAPRPRGDDHDDDDHGDEDHDDDDD